MKLCGVRLQSLLCGFVGHPRAPVRTFPDTESGKETGRADKKGGQWGRGKVQERGGTRKGIRICPVVEKDFLCMHSGAILCSPNLFTYRLRSVVVGWRGAGIHCGATIQGYQDAGMLSASFVSRTKRLVVAVDCIVLLNVNIFWFPPTQR